jgi:hypothetical protein
LVPRVVCPFQNTIINKPGGLLEREFTRKGRIEHHFIVVESISIVFIEVKKILAIRKAGLDMKAPECAGMLMLFTHTYIAYVLAACDYTNLKRGYILAILCDGKLLVMTSNSSCP